MLRTIIHIDQDKCNGCGACVTACHEGAIGMRDGKAVLLRDDYCDGLGHCLPVCPTQALSFEERAALPYDAAAVEKNMRQCTPVQSLSGAQLTPLAPLAPLAPPENSAAGEIPTGVDIQSATQSDMPSCLRNWPVQLRLVPVQAAFLEGADLLIAADCCAYACATFHQQFMTGKVTLIGCPKLDPIAYAEKLTEIFSTHAINSVCVVRMQVPCCHGLESAVRQAAERCGKPMHVSVTVMTREGQIAAATK